MSAYRAFEQTLTRFLSTRAGKVMPIVLLALGLIGFPGLLRAPTNPVPFFPPIPYTIMLILAEIGIAAGWFIICLPAW